MPGTLDAPILKHTIGQRPDRAIPAGPARQPHVIRTQYAPFSQRRCCRQIGDLSYSKSYASLGMRHSCIIGYLAELKRRDDLEQLSVVSSQ